MGFKLTKAAAVAGWALGVGDSLRAAGKALAIIMLVPGQVPHLRAAAPLFRMRVGKRMTHFEVRAHDASRCTRGRWQGIDKAPTPTSAREWGKLAKFWAWAAAEYDAGRPDFCWTTDRNKDQNRCHSKAHANHLKPLAIAGSVGRGTRRPDLPSRFDALGHDAPATGKALGTHDPGRIKARASRMRAARASRRHRAINARLRRENGGSK
jgi:hypothetical protein